MATRAKLSSSVDRVPREGNPFIHVPFALQDLTGIDVNGGGGKMLVEVDGDYRAQLNKSLSGAVEKLSVESQQYPDLPGVLIVKLRETGIAKSHRPIGLIAEAELPPAGHAAIDEMLVAANPVNLAQLSSVIATRNTQQIKSNLSAVDRFETWGAERRLPASIIAMAPPARDAALRGSGRLFVRLFRHRDDNITQRGVARLSQFLTDAGAQYSLLEQHSGPPLFVVDAGETLTAAALSQLSEFPSVRSVAPEPLAETSPLQDEEGALPPHNLAAGPPDASPVVAVFDTGVHIDATLLTPWIASTDVYVTDVDTNYVHGTQVSSLVADARGLNANHVWLPPAACRIHDVCGLESGTGKVGDLILRLRTAVAARPDIHIWNLSLGAKVGISDDEFSEFGRELDALSDQHGVLFVVASGNYVSEPRRSWPVLNDLQDRLSSPGDSVRALTIGAIAHMEHVAGLVHAGEPASYSRRGPGPVFTPKPDLVHVGGGVNEPWDCVTSGMNVLVPGNGIKRSVGTSFATPVAAAMAAHAWQALEGDRQHGLSITPTLVKALMIHGAEVSSPHRSAWERRYFGSGMPSNPLSILFDGDDSFTLIFEADLAANSKWLKTPYPVPAPLIVDGRLRAEIIITCAYAPPLDAQYGAEYVRANIEVGFGVMALNPRTGKIEFRGCVPLEGEPGASGFEAAQIEHGGKWSPVKVLRKKFPQGKAGEVWALRAGMTRRAFEPPLAEPLRAVIAVTLRAIDGNQTIHTAGLQALAQTNWIHQVLPTHVPIHV